MLDAGPLKLRPWRASDAEALVRYVNNRKIWINLRDRFPHPYTEADAKAWLALRAADSGKPHSLGIEFQKKRLEESALNSSPTSIE